MKSLSYPLIAIAFVLFSSSLFAQKIKVEYAVRLNPNDGVSNRVTDYILEINGQQSIYYNPKLDPNDLVYGFIGVPNKTEDRITVQVNESVSIFLSKDRFYKNYTTDSLIFNDYAQNVPLVVYEPIDGWNWAIEQGSDTLILGKQCYKAITDHRGRTYEAYFAPAVLSYGGPWKFDGLPGLILSVHSQDDYFAIYPTKLTINADDSFVVNPYKGNEILDWAGYIETVKDVLEKVARKLKSSFGPGGKVVVTDRIEAYPFGPIEY